MRTEPAVARHSDVGSRVARPARVDLPRLASGSTYVADVGSGVAVRFALEGARDAEVAITDGMAVYRGALGDGATVVQRIRSEGTEDSVSFERP